jgi:hypothetical protein
VPIVLDLADLSTLGDGLISVSARATDAAGNASTVGMTSFTLDSATAAVTNVTSALPDRTYGIGETVEIQVVFGESVSVTGTPVLALNLVPARVATYTRGSGSTTLVFSYAVLPGDVATDLNYTSTNALTGGVITDLAGNAAGRALPGLTAVGSLATNKNIAIDGAIVASATGFGTTPDGPSLSTAVSSVQILFNTPVTGVTINSVRLYYEGRLVSLRDAQITGSGTTWTLALPLTATNLVGRYRLDVGGASSGIVSGGVTMNSVSSIYWRRA